MATWLDNIMSGKTKYGLFVSLCLIAIYLADNFLFGRVVRGLVGSYFLPSMAWLLLAAVVIYCLPIFRPQCRPRHRKLLYWLALLGAMAGVIAVYAAGLMEGFGRSPYDQSLRGIVINLFFLGSMLVGMEYTRSWVVNYLFKKRPVFGIVFTGLVFTFFTFSPSRLFSFETTLAGARFAGNTFLPNLAEGILTSYLAFLGGPLAAIIYRGTLLAFQWFMPVVPDLNWVIKALIGTFVPAFALVFIYQLYRTEVLRIRSRESENPLGWIAASSVSVVMIWFAVGVFNIFPNVIVSGSMEPEIDIGDIVIVQSIEPELVREGDVIQFRDLERDVRINHRVIEISEDDRGKPLFITQGDANNSPDSDPVYAEQLQGKVMQVVPKIGWVTILLRNPG